MALETVVVQAGPEDKVRFEVVRDDASFVVNDVRLINEFPDQVWRENITEVGTSNTWSLTAQPNTTATLTNQQRNFLRSRNVKVMFSREATVATVGDRQLNLATELIRVS